MGLEAAAVVQRDGELIVESAAVVELSWMKRQRQQLCLLLAV